MSFGDIYLKSICDTPFWNDTLTWNTTQPVLTPCFTSTALVWLPSLFLLFCFPYTLYDYVSAKRASIKWNRLNVFKLLVALGLVIIGAVRLSYVIIHWHADDGLVNKSELIGSIIGLLIYCLLAAFVHLQRVCGFVNGGAVWFYLLLQMICTGLEIPTFIKFFNHKSSTEHIIFYIKFAIEVILFFVCSFADYSENELESCSNKNGLAINSDQLCTECKVRKANTNKLPLICPKENAAFPSKLTFWWFNSISMLGFRRTLTIDDLWQIRAHDHATNLFARFNHFWKHKSFSSNETPQDDLTDQHQSSPKSSILFIIVCQFWSFFTFPCAARFITDNLQLVNPLVMKYVISFVSDPTAPFWHGMFYTIIFVVINVASSITTAYQQHRMGILGMRIRTCLISAIYRKSLVLAMHSKKNYTTGEIINLMSVDSQRFIDLFPWLNYVWTAPVQVGIAMWLLWRELGISVLGGLLLMLLFVPIQGYVAGWVKKIQAQQMKLKDERLKAVNEMLNGIKVLKLYAWEEAFIENIQKIRVQELKFIRKSGFAFTIFNIIAYGSPLIVLSLTFGLYMWLEPDGILTAQKVFVSVALFNMLRVPIAMIPNMTTNLIMTMISLKRIGKFLNSDEVIPYVDRKVDDENAVVMSNASFNWDLVNESSLSTSTLSNIDLTVPKGSLVAVVGSVGSGKSSLLHALLGEMHKLTGKLNISGDQRVAYVAQQAWIQNNTLRENILFGQKIEFKRYRKIIDACALQADLEILKAKDLTEIGEKGINLSGGQKQRVSIARACYSDANLYLFDDPLSAVDSHVSKHIFSEVFDSKTGILRNKTRILVTNALFMLPNVDQIVLLKNGTVDAVGSYDHLMKFNSVFAKLIKNYTNSTEESEEKEEEEEIKLVKQKNDLPNEITKERHQSIMSSTSRGETPGPSEATEPNSKLVEAERMETGQVTLGVYKKFIQSLSAFWFGAIVLGFFLMSACTTGSNIWLSVWTSDTKADSLFYLLWYIAISVAYILVVCFAWLSIIFGTYRASKTLHSGLVNSIVHAPMYWFDTTPLGRIVNRFSKDIDVLDSNMTQNLRVLMNTIFNIFATIFIVSLQTPLFLTIVVPFLAIYIFIQRFYVATSRQLKRLESVTRSPIFNHFAETINGVCTIKAYNATERFILESDKRVDENQRCVYPNVAVSICWLQVRLDAMANCLIFFASLFAVLSKPAFVSDTETGSGTGLSLSYALNITIYLNMCVRMFADLENNIVSVERISEYTQVQPEADWHTQADERLVANWPDGGVIRFEKYGTRYRPGLDLVLKKIDFSTGRGEKIGIVGRTGAGKSSLTLALFRIIEAANGKIWMDGIDISDLGLQTLRSRITIIPQDPVLFCGTIRSNLDPFSIYADNQLWNILELAHLKTFVSSLPMGLDHAVSEGGENLAMGQRQLICLARALLRRTRVLVLDEATAAVDLETDSLIQSTIRHQFAHCTVLTIAHRLHTILDSDRVMVLDAGNVAEFDSPTNLLANQRSLFYLLAKDAGIVS